MSETTTARTFRLDDIGLSDLRATDLRREAVAANWSDDTWSREEIAERLDDMDRVALSNPPTGSRPAIAYRLTIDGEAETADVLVAMETGRVGIAWGADAAWGNLGDWDATGTDDDPDGYRLFRAALVAAINDWLNDGEAWDARA